MPFRAKPLHLLIVEDNPGDFFLIDDYLREEVKNLKIDHAQSFTQAKELLKSFTFDAILLDLSLPDNSGENLVNEVIQLAGPTPVIVLTGYTDKEFGIKTLTLGVSDYLLKDDLTGAQLYKSIMYSIERKRIYSRLNESEENYRNLFQLSPLPMFLFDDLTYQFLNVNEAAIQHYGYSRVEFLSLTINDIRPQEDIERTKLIMESTRISGLPYHGLGRHCKKNGEIIQVEIKSNIIDFEGKQARLVLANDITEKLQYQEQLARYNQRLETAQEIAKLGYWEIDLRTHSAYWSDEMYRILGMEDQESPPTLEAYIELIHPDDREMYTTVKNDALKGLINQHAVEYRILSADGSLKYIYQKGSLIYEDGILARIEGIIQDITQRKKEEAHLKLLESVITHTTDAVIITEAAPLDEPGPRIMFVNEAFCKMTGYTKEEVLGKSPRFMQGPKTNKEELTRLRKALEDKQPCEIEVINYKKNGEEFWVNMTVTPMSDSNNSYTHFIAIEKDITTRKKQDQEITKAIIQAQEEERRYVAGELHDNVNQILAGARIGLGMAKNAPTSEVVTWIDQSSQHVDKAIKEIRQLSHRLAPASLTDNTLKDIVEDLLYVMNLNKQFQVSFQFDHTDQVDISDELEINLYRILQEQLNNIVKYANASVIEISFMVLPGRIRMRIYDNGKGFDVGATRYGFGLSNIRKRTELFQGHFTLNTSLNNGCEIIVEIPL